MTREGISLPSFGCTILNIMEKSKLKTSSQEVFSSSVDVNLLITSMFFLVKMCEDLHPMEVKKEFAIMKKLPNNREKLLKMKYFMRKNV